MRIGLGKLWKVGRLALPYVAGWLWRKFKPKDKETADLFEHILSILLEEIIEENPDVRPELIPRYMATRLGRKFPQLTHAQLLKIASDYCIKDNNLHDAIKNS